MTQVKTSRWKIGLPIYPPSEVSDNSTRQEYVRCMRKGFYRYGMRRGFEGKNWSIQYGLAYHKYREAAENFMREKESKMTDEIHDLAWEAAIDGWEDPPFGHKKEYLDQGRLFAACMMAKKRIELEQQTGSIKVTRSEDSFDLELPFAVCNDCGWAVLVDDMAFDGVCSHCQSHNAVRVRHGGRVDQFVEFMGSLYIRDWKTTSYKPYHYETKFDPSSQMMGYVWAGSRLSGRTFRGALIETVFNTKTKGPEISQHYVDFSQGQMEQWIASQMMHEQFIRTAWARVEELGYLAFPQNTDACTAMGVCGFLEACRMGSGREIDSWLDTYTIYSHWDFTDPDGEASDV